jgi:hypothetical protein
MRRFLSVKTIRGQLSYLIDLGAGHSDVKVQADQRLDIGIDGLASGDAKAVFRMTSPLSARRSWRRSQTKKAPGTLRAGALFIAHNGFAVRLFFNPGNFLLSHTLARAVPSGL